MFDGTLEEGGKDGKDEGVVTSAESCFSVAWRFYVKWDLWVGELCGWWGEKGEIGRLTWINISRMKDRVWVVEW